MHYALTNWLIEVWYLLFERKYTLYLVQHTSNNPLCSYTVFEFVIYSMLLLFALINIFILDMHFEPIFIAILIIHTTPILSSWIHTNGLLQELIRCISADYKW